MEEIVELNRVWIEVNGGLLTCRIMINVSSFKRVGDRNFYLSQLCARHSRSKNFAFLGNCNWQYLEPQCINSPISVGIRSLCTAKSSDSHDKESTQRDKKVLPTNDSATSANAKPTVKTIGPIKSAINVTVDFIVNPRQSWRAIKEVIDHYWMGTKLLWSEMKVAKEIIGKISRGGGMSRRERIQLLRTTTDLFRLVPFSLFIIIPFMELLLPFALKLFPNMLPSTFQDSITKQESMKKELQMRFAVANFMQETMKEMAERKSRKLGKAGETEDEHAAGAKELIEFMDKARIGEAISNDAVVRIARLFKDELTLDNISRPQLVSMCRYMGLQAYGGDMFLRFQLRVKLNSIKDDDRRILWEGIDSLNTLELKEACRERGMRSYDLTHFRLKRQLNEWLQLSTQKNIPISLLIMSRAFNLVSTPDEESVDESPESLLTRSMSSLDLDMVNEVVIAAASPLEADTKEIRKRKLESIEFQKEMIKEEKHDREPKLVESAQKDEQTDDQTAVSSHADPSSSRIIEIIDTAVSPIEKEDLEDAEDSERARATVRLTLDEVEALCDLARGSVLQREKSALAVLQATLDLSKHVTDEGDVKETKQALLSSSSSSSPPSSDSELFEMLPQSKIVNPLYERHLDTFLTEAVEMEEGGGPHPDKSLTNLQGVVSSMLDKLKIQLDTTEKALGDNVYLLDSDGDGKISAEEIREAVVRIVNRPSSVGEAEKLIELLDTNKDGTVSLVDLLQYIKKKREKMEQYGNESEDSDPYSKPK